MSKHSPGPWIFGVEEWDDDAARRKPVAKPFDYSGPGHYDNPSIFGADGNEIVGCDEYMVFRNPADIRLLVAAPDLLEALKSAAEYLHDKSGCLWLGSDFQRGCRCSEDCSSIAVWKQARAAIAKAEGSA